MKNFIVKNALYLALIQAIVAMLGSLYFSEIMQLTPCVLCWYQRIAMYPLVLALIVGIMRKDKYVYLYILPPALIGWTISIYHNLLYYKIIPDALAPCSTGVSCTTRYVHLFGGLVTIPLLSFLAFSIIILLMTTWRKAVVQGRV